MRLVLDMNLSPDWVPLLRAKGWEAVHWSRFGSWDATDREIMKWALEQRHVVITQDMDFSQLLFATCASGPSVVLLRMDNEFDERTRDRVCAALSSAEPSLVKGALLTISGARVRLRILPITPDAQGGPA